MRLPSFLSIADVCLTPASRRGDVGQAAVPSLDAQIAESRRGFARRVAGSLSSSSLCRGFLPLLLCGFLASSVSISVSILVSKKKPKKLCKKKPNNSSKTTTRKTVKKR